MTRTSSAPLDNRTTDRFGEPLMTVPTEDRPIFSMVDRARILSAGRAIDKLALFVCAADTVDFVIGRFGATEEQLEQEFQADMNYVPTAPVPARNGSPSERDAWMQQALSGTA
jgi:hypothetical protein